MDLLLLQFCAVAKEKMEHAIILRMAKCFELDDLVTSPSTPEEMFRFSPSYIQDFLRIILLVVRDRRNTGMKEEESLQYDVIQWLCVRDQTYSQVGMKIMCSYTLCLLEALDFCSGCSCLSFQFHIGSTYFCHGGIMFYCSR
jgi:hypothetical protein